MADHTLVIGTYNTSSWSLRGWLACRLAGLAFDEQLIDLDSPTRAAQIAAQSPNGMVPCLKRADGFAVWESLAIAEYVQEQGNALLWPGDDDARAHARAISAEMHAGFAELRRQYPMDIKGRVSGRAPTDGTRAAIERVTHIWREARTRYGAGGPYLFGELCGAADAMFAPVVTRFRTYGVTLDPLCQAYSNAMFAQPDMAEWVARAERG
jgi:glutathione S-transferase